MQTVVGLLPSRTIGNLATVLVSNAAVYAEALETVPCLPDQIDSVSVTPSHSKAGRRLSARDFYAHAGLDSGLSAPETWELVLASGAEEDVEAVRKRLMDVIFLGHVDGLVKSLLMLVLAHMWGWSFKLHVFRVDLLYHGVFLCLSLA